MVGPSRLGTNFPVGIRPSSSYNTYATGPLYGATSIPVGTVMGGEAVSGTALGGAYIGSSLPRVSSGNLLPGVTTTTGTVDGKNGYAGQRTVVG